MALAAFSYYIPDAMTPVMPLDSDARAPAHGIGVMFGQYIATAAFVGWGANPSTFVALSSAPDSVNVMLGSHGTQIITAPYMISAILIKRAKAQP